MVAASARVYSDVLSMLSYVQLSEEEQNAALDIPPGHLITAFESWLEHQKYPSMPLSRHSSFTGGHVEATVPT